MSSIQPDLAPLPWTTPDLPGVGGSLKSEADHFIVEELPLYEPCGEGEHLYLEIRRSNLNSRDVVRKLIDCFDLKSDREVGMAGLKDRNARTTQRFSLHLPGVDDSTIAAALEKLPPELELLLSKRHTNKLRTGHLRANRFTLLLGELKLPLDEALVRVETIAESILNSGFANFYGEQRFGNDGVSNAVRGRELLFSAKDRKRTPQWKRRLFLSALQSELFNAVVAERARRQELHTILTGDLLQKVESGGLFVCEELALDSSRFAEGEVSWSGPIFGKKMRRPEGEPLAIEESVLAQAELSHDLFAAAGLDGTRRAAIIRLSELTIKADQEREGLLFSFTLPPGSYATVLLEEFQKCRSFS